MKLPLEFLKKMNEMLGNDEYEQFIESFRKPRYYGLRVNTLKIGVEEFKNISPFDLEPVPWASDGFYYPEGENPGRHPYYHAGLYYIQEPSAMLPGEIINAQPGERVLDLCAAPGGKTVQMAAGMKGKGLLVANDISSSRLKALVKNIELCGVKNAIVTNEPPERLAGKFRNFFDRILVDAPCSGEGMFRKDDEAARSWEKYKCEKCAGMQREILQYVDEMLKPGGILVYSTCTFSPEEDERMVSFFLDGHKHYEVLEIPKTGGIEPGRPEWADGRSELAKTVRLWPHKLKGEGHFVAMLKKKPLSSDCRLIRTIAKGTDSLENHSVSETVSIPAGIIKFKKEKREGSREWEALLDMFGEFVEGNLNTSINGSFQIKGSNLYCLPEPPPDLEGIKVAKFGWYLGEFSNGKFEPSHSMLMALRMEDVKNVVNFPSGSREILSYLKGETLAVDGNNGFVAVCVDGYTVGWAKQTGDMLKNLYPKGWRVLK